MIKHSTDDRVGQFIAGVFLALQQVETVFGKHCDEFEITALIWDGETLVAERYERAIKWLEGVQAGKIIPDLPLNTDEDGTPTGDLLIFGSQKQLRHNW